MFDKATMDIEGGWEEGLAMRLSLEQARGEDGFSPPWS